MTCILPKINPHDHNSPLKEVEMATDEFRMEEALQTKPLKYLYTKPY